MSKARNKSVTSLLLIYVLLSLGGVVLGTIAGFKLWGVLLAGLGNVLLFILASLIGVFVTLDGMTGTIRKINDGKDALMIVWNFGPFSYERKIPPMLTET
ncbi:MAG: hypothetical protein K1W05_05350, partial [Desulfovibrio sp.]